MTTGKSDMDRVGLFQEMGYHTISDPYNGKQLAGFNEAAGKGRQLYPGGEKSKSALPAGYFAEYHRILEGEAYSDPIQIRRDWRKKEAQKIIGKAFYPSAAPKVPSGIGSHYGTFSGPIQYFNAIASKEKAGISGKNFITNPPKKGSGYGYANVFLAKLPDYVNEPYDVARNIAKKESDYHKTKLNGRPEFKISGHVRGLFDTNPFHGETEKFSLPPIQKSGSAPVPFKPSNPPKKPGGNKSGCFDPFPTYASEPYVVRSDKDTSKSHDVAGKKFVPSSGNKTAPMRSILNQNILRSINNNNFRSIERVSAY
jgi:hypothetical protein